MGKTILTPEQHIVLDMAAKSELIYSLCYFTGGTALSEFYLHHRLSEDLDFFSNSPISHQQVDQFVNSAAQELNATISKQSILGHGTYMLTYDNKKSLKLDFVYQPYKQLETGKKYYQLQIASLWDIVVDKLYTIFHRANARDFVDLYLSIQKVGANFEQVVSAMEEKYDAGFDTLSLLSRLPIVKDLKDYPTMLVPFEQKDMENFFLDITKDMEDDIFK